MRGLCPEEFSISSSKLHAVYMITDGYACTASSSHTARETGVLAFRSTSFRRALSSLFELLHSHGGAMSVDVDIDLARFLSGGGMAAGTEG